MFYFSFAMLNPAALLLATLPLACGLAPVLLAQAGGAAAPDFASRFAAKSVLFATDPAARNAALAAAPERLVQKLQLLLPADGLDGMVSSLGSASRATGAAAETLLASASMGFNDVAASVSATGATAETLLASASMGINDVAASVSAAGAAAETLLASAAMGIKDIEASVSATGAAAETLLASASMEIKDIAASACATGAAAETMLASASVVIKDVAASATSLAQSEAGPAWAVTIAVILLAIFREDGVRQGAEAVEAGAEAVRLAVEMERTRGAKELSEALSVAEAELARAAPFEQAARAALASARADLDNVFEFEAPARPRSSRQAASAEKRKIEYEAGAATRVTALRALTTAAGAAQATLRTIDATIDAVRLPLAGALPTTGTVPPGDIAFSTLPPAGIAPPAVWAAPLCASLDLERRLTVLAARREEALAQLKGLSALERDIRRGEVIYIYI